MTVSHRTNQGGDPKAPVRERLPLAQQTYCAVYNNEQSFMGLREWLAARDFDNYRGGWKDSKGTPCIGLSKGRMRGQSEKRGVIGCYENTAERVEELVNEAMNGK